MSEPTVFCCECMYLLGNRGYREEASKWQCVAPQNVLSIRKDPVSAAPIRELEHATCYDARRMDSACGVVGQWYAKYEKPDYSGRKPQAPTADDLLKELEP